MTNNDAARQLPHCGAATASRFAIAGQDMTVYESPDPSRIFCYSPGLAVSPRSGTQRFVATTGCRGAGVPAPVARIVATTDIGGPGVRDGMPGCKWQRGEGGYAWQGKVFTSDDGGRSWQHRADFPFMHARPFSAGGAVYILGHAGDLMVIRSDDAGSTWGEPARLTEGQTWHQAPCNVHYANGCVYLVMERRTRSHIKGWPVGDMAPVLMRGRLDADLTCPENWTLASEVSFYEVMDGHRTDYFGVPFYAADPVHGVMAAPGRHCAPMGWLETNVVQFTDPDHLWHDPTGRTFHLWMRAHTGGSGYACIARVVEQGDAPGTGAMTTMLETAPSGKTMLYVPCPGGQMKFHVVYDEPTNCFWLLSTQATDSMIRPDRMPADRYNLPNNERRRLQLHFSTNMIDWCFAGLVAVGPVEKASRHYAAMAIDGDDLVVLSRSGDERAKTPHDGNLITFHRIPRFRDLVY